ncbi:hypothetical protein FB382_004355 [Nocardioides ginsengisegetis]|uniref:Uncharacterized protein n=1 Tax=Nocardioides ginsengisegetis TaxID=661491 RepID=A0A7W3J4H7_9ACTN|nr:hypothetical protein [Nocardioides ginsengisegetis]MBA8805580.1 hypothetical protein [Nocardioides ginsengisegetis]MBA8806004.1 hypothetical protein [Nocardioides ginsengisegetis]
MSADNWGVCPQCKVSRERDIANTERAVAETYGKVSVEKFDDARARLEAKRAEPIQYTLREDYEMGLDEDGEFYVIYSGGCRECGLTHKFKHSEQVDLTGGAA